MPYPTPISGISAPSRPISARSCAASNRYLIPEINNGQLIRIIRDQFLINAVGYNKVMGIPITRTELVMKIREMLGSNN